MAHFGGKRPAAEQAYQAGITGPRTAIDLAEVHDSFSGAELQAYEDLGFCCRGEGGIAAADGRFESPRTNTGKPVTPTVGGQALGRFVEKAAQTRRAGVLPRGPSP